VQEAGRRAVGSPFLQTLGEEVLGERRAGVGEQHRALDLVGELAHVARKRVAGEQRERLVAGLADGLLQLRREPSRQMPGEGRDVLPPVAQRRQADRKDAQAVVQVLAEAARLHLVLEATVGGRDHPYVDRAGPGLADGAYLALLEHPQELRLERPAGLGDLVEEERAAVGHLEEPLPIGDGAGERAAPVAEELARSEEHTSELQSLAYLVCRLL